MNLKPLAYIGAILALFGSYVFTEQFGEHRYRDKMLALPPDTSKAVNLPPKLVQGPPEVHTGTIIPPKRETRPTASLPPLRANREDSLTERIAELEQPVHFTLTDNHGGTHDINYDPVAENITETYTPMIIIQPQDRYITRNLPEIPEPLHNFWIGVDALYAGGAGVMGTVGFRQLGCKVGVINDKFAWGLECRFDL